MRRVVSVFDLLLTPWFAVGVGLVIAAAAGAATPRAELTFAPGPTTSRCHLIHCAAVRAKAARDEVGAHGGPCQGALVARVMPCGTSRPGWTRVFAPPWDPWWR